jgi:hypothetical protein
MTHTIPYYGFEFEEFLNDSNSILHHEEPPAAAAEVDEFHVFINPVTIHQTPAQSIVDANPYVPQSSAPIPRNFCCPFYTSNPSEHPKCKDKKFSYMCRVRCVSKPHSALMWIADILEMT